MSVTKIEFEKQERAIELPDGTILDIPERTKENDDKIQAVLHARTSMKEYDYTIKLLEVMFGKDGVKKIVPNAKNVNMDYLAAVQLGALNAFYADKEEAEREEMRKSIDNIEPLTDKLKAVNPLLAKLT